ncbi:hypothetical protein PG995_005376 [Apiospora arundinis]
MTAHTVAPPRLLLHGSGSARRDHLSSFLASSLRRARPRAALCQRPQWAPSGKGLLAHTAVPRRLLPRGSGGARRAHLSSLLASLLRLEFPRAAPAPYLGVPEWSLSMVAKEARLVRAQMVLKFGVRCEGPSPVHGFMPGTVSIGAIITTLYSSIVYP